MRPRVDPLADPEPLIRRVYAYVAYRIGAGAEAEDVVGDVFERALRYRDSYDPRRGEPAAWLVGIARRLIAERPRVAPVTLAAHAERAAPGDLELDVVRRVELGDALRTLPDRERELIALRYGADLTARQIGEIVGSRTNTVEVAIHRALETLRERLYSPAKDR